MRVLAADDELVGLRIERPRPEAVDKPRRDAQRAEHVAHRAGEELAVALVRREEEVVDGVDALRSLGVQRVGELGRAEVGLDRGRLVVWRGRSSGGHDLNRKLVDPLLDGRQPVIRCRQ